MKKILRNLVAGSMLGLASLLPSRNAKAEDKPPIIDGWVEATAGINQGPNLRLYPALRFKKFKLNSLTDVNGYFSFTKTNLSHDDLELKLGRYATLKPRASFHANPYIAKITADANIEVSTSKCSGYFEVDLNPRDMRNPEFFTYHNLDLKAGNLGIFAMGPLKDIKSTYTEIDFTAKDIKDSGISPYARINFTKGARPTYQAGISISPRDAAKKFKRNKN